MGMNDCTEVLTKIRARQPHWSQLGSSQTWRDLEGVEVAGGFIRIYG